MSARLVPGNWSRHLLALLSRAPRRPLLPGKLIDISKPTLADVTAGLTVAIVALPLALAFGLASGATAKAGLYAAIAGGIVAALFGGSKVNISGPTGAMSVVLIDVAARHGFEGMLAAGALAGLMQIGLGIARAGGLIKYLPHCLIVGFTAGIAVIIFTGQIATFREAPLVGLATAAVMVGVKTLWPNGPAALIGLLAGVGVNAFVGGPTVTGIPQSLPELQFSFLNPATMLSVTGAAVTICLLGSIEGLLSATVADTMGTHRRHNPDKELIGQGFGNIASALIGGVPITGAIARTSVAVKSGARTEWTSIIHALVLLAVALIFAPYAQYVPLAGLAAILMVTSVYMVEWKSLKVLPHAPPHYATVLITTLVLTVLTDLTIAVLAGFAMATVLFAFRFTREPICPCGLSLPDSVTKQAAVHTLNGPLFFGVAERLFEHLDEGDQPYVILDMRNVPMIDATGAFMLERLHTSLKRHGRTLIVCGLTARCREVIERLNGGEPLPYIVLNTESEIPQFLAQLNPIA